MYKLELIWHLVELPNWVSLHFPACEECARLVFYFLIPLPSSVYHKWFFPRSGLSQGSESPEQHGDYWEAVTQFVLQGRVDQARNLSRLHSEFTTDPFSSLDELLRKMPVCSSASSATQFEFSWRAWQVEVKTRKAVLWSLLAFFHFFPFPGDLKTAGGGLCSLP